MRYDVIIPARNEESTIDGVTRAFVGHAAINQVIVVIDDDTTDGTAGAVCAGVTVRWGPKGGGKGQNIKSVLDMVKTRRVILCDADLEGLTKDHVSKLIADDTPFVIGVPDFPLTEVMLSPKMTWQWLPSAVENYKRVSGERVVGTNVLRNLDLHGYLIEVQINAAYQKMGIQPAYRHLRGLYSPFWMDDERMSALLRDRKWGEENGVFRR